MVKTCEITQDLDKAYKLKIMISLRGGGGYGGSGGGGCVCVILILYDGDSCFSTGCLISTEKPDAMLNILN